MLASNNSKVIREEIAELIDDYSQNLLVLYRICKNYFKNVNISPLVNFRDALAHYVVLYEATSQDEIIQQSILIKDHLDRGYKDQVLFVLHYVNIKLHLLLDPPKGEPLVLKNKIQLSTVRIWLHKTKNLILDIRENSSRYSYCKDAQELLDCNKHFEELQEEIEKVDILNYFQQDQDIYSLTLRYTKISDAR